jgi:NADH dehydrogenase [ubiquinone] 1 alpha subcomplex assembly factor 7
MAGEAARMTGPAGDTGAALRARIARDGPIGVDAFMRIAVAHYYATRDPFGAAGDFVTAPETTQVFGELIGLWCADTWQAMGGPARVALVELGPGRGTLMADALRAAATVPGFRAALRVHLVETSPSLRERQHAALGAMPAGWHERFATVPDDAPMLVIANEFLDALPVRQLVRTGRGWRERCVGLGPSERFVFVADEDGPDRTAQVPPALRDAAPGAVFELGDDARALAAEIAGRMARCGGAALIVDYGHAQPGLGDTLQSVRRHAPSDPLADPGAADLTAHVDFAALGEAARARGVRVAGPEDQGRFLVRLGIETRAARLIAAANPDQAMLIRSGCRRLIDPLEMGTLFQVIAFAHPDQPSLAGLESERRPR